MHSIPSIDHGDLFSSCQSLIEDNFLRGRSHWMPNDGRDKERKREAHADSGKMTVFREIKEVNCSKGLGDVQSALLNSPTCSPKTDVAFCQEYLANRVKEHRHTKSDMQLFKEIQSKGYRGSLRQVRKFMATIRKEQCLLEERLAFHRDYLIKRLEETHHTVSGAELFEEVRSKGYRGSFRTVQRFLAKVRKVKISPEVPLAFHRDYLIKRLEETHYTVSGAELFREIQAKGYRGTVGHLQSFVAEIRKAKVPPQAYLAFHQSYLAKRMEETRYVVSSAQLFREIQARGYRGSVSNVKNRVMMMRREISLKEVQTGGYRGSIKSVQDFLTKKEELSPSSLSFHKNYLIKRIEETRGDYVPVSTLCGEIRANGYQGSNSQVYKFVAATTKDRSASSGVLQRYKDCLIEKVEANLPRRCSACKLFKEIQTKGYRGSLRVVQEFLSAIYKMKQSQNAFLKK